MKVLVRQVLLVIVVGFISASASSRTFAMPGDIVNDGGKSQSADTKQTDVSSGSANPSLTNSQACSGEDCPPDIADLGGSSTSVAVSSPFGHIFETMNSAKTTEMLGDTLYATSPLAQAATTWYLTDGVIASGILKAFDFSMRMGGLRYQAEQAIQGTLTNNGAEGRRIWEAYTGCLTRLTQKGISLGAAQETCLGQWDRPQAAAGLESNLDAQKDAMSLKHHPSHPLYRRENIVNGTGQDNAALIGDFFGNNAAEDEIRLTHLIFTNPVIAVKRRGTQDQLDYLKALYASWRQIFGDIIITEKRHLPGSAFFGSDMRMDPAQFQYMSAITDARMKETVDPFANNPATPFLQWARYRQDAVYYKLMKVMSKYCHYLKSSSVGGTEITDFWQATENPIGDKTLSIDELRSISPSFQDMSKQNGVLIYAFLQSVTGFDKRKIDSSEPQDACDTINPEVVNSKATLKSIADYFGPSNTGDGRSSDRFAGPMKFVHRLAGIIASSQINESFREINRIVMVISGGNFEDFARKAAVDLIQSTLGGEWDYFEALKQSQTGYYQMLESAQEWSNREGTVVNNRSSGGGA